MKVNSNHFIKEAEIAILDRDMTASVFSATDTAYKKRLNAMFESGITHGEAMRQQSAKIKRHGLSNLPDLLEQAESNLIENGTEVLWAIDAEEARQHVLDLIEKHQIKSVVKSKSMVSEEISLNHALEEQGIEVIETDLGEYIIQLAEEAPSHIVTPVIHKSKDSIRDLFVEKIGMPYTDDVDEMTNFARVTLREKFLNADMGVSGGNFIIAETGTLCLVTNEGNGRLVTGLPRIHVAIVGIEKVIESLEDYATLTQVLPRSATGQNLTVYTHMYNGPKRAGDPDGPEHMVVIFVDNGRSKIYNSNYAEVLTCIRCGACMNACPVYQATGGHAYGWVYPGPIGAVITPLLNGLSNAKPLPHASSLCGLCKEVCPVDINLPGMLLELRSDLYQENKMGWGWRWGLKFWALGFGSPSIFRFGSKVAGRILGNIGWANHFIFFRSWTKQRNLPTLAKRSFHQEWKARREK